jgi:predicted methyltransferase MtxX (methanogen marker protein 4)
MIDTRAIGRCAPGPEAVVGLGAAPGVGPPKAGGLSRSPFLRTYAEAPALVRALRGGAVGAGVRGTLAPAAVLAALAPPAGRGLSRGVLLEPRPGQGVLFGPVGITEGRGVVPRGSFAAWAARTLIDYGLSSEDPLIAVLSSGRSEDGPRGAHIARSLAESARVVEGLEKRGLDAFHAGAQVEDVIGHADIVVAPDGASGNLAFRALHLVCGMRSFGALVLGARAPFVDTSRSRASFEDPVRLAAFLASAAAAR